MAEVSDVKQSILGNYEMKSWLRLAFFFVDRLDPSDVLQEKSYRLTFRIEPDKS
ncbi:hypothetical protein [Ileibacterium valens]|uniref:hypothetical protein n=1 Tax=Ileibacterium valens TaxID=1862668 RepID=UPI0025704777|nr:hypothetical protein [Ileibacterium valens]